MTTFESTVQRRTIDSRLRHSETLYVKMPYILEWYGYCTYICQNSESMATPNQSNARFDTRLSMEQKIFFERAATLGGYRNLTDFVIRTVQERAEELIEERERIVASKKDSEIFFKALTGRKKPNKSLMQAAKEYQEYISK